MLTSLFNIGLTLVHSPTTTSIAVGWFALNGAFDTN